MAHPITVALILSLEADIEGIKEDWSNGNYPSIEENTKAIGLVQASDSVVEWITELLQIEE